MRASIAAKVVGILTLVYGANYLITPILFGEGLEIRLRPRPYREFDSVTWKSGGLDRNGRIGKAFGERYAMLDDAMRSHIIRSSTSTTKLRTEFGEPDFIKKAKTGELWFYVLAEQRQYPVESIFFPGRFSNFDKWMLEIRIEKGVVVSVKVYFT